MKKTLDTSGNYQNNPFFVAIEGIDRLFSKALSVGILLAVISLLGLTGPLRGEYNLDDNKSSDQSAQDISALPIEAWMAIGLAGFVVLSVILAIGIVLKGITDYTASKIAKGEETNLSEAFHAVFANFWSYVWLSIIMAVKIFLWSLLFVVPGIIMAVRYSLAGVSFFETGKRGNAAIKDSLALTKGAFVTTFASQSLLNLLTLGIISPLLTPGTNGTLYGQFRTPTDKGLEKPQPHKLSWMTLILTLALFILFVLAVVSLAAWAVVNYQQISIDT